MKSDSLVIKNSDFFLKLCKLFLLVTSFYVNMTIDRVLSPSVGIQRIVVLMDQEVEIYNSIPWEVQFIISRLVGSIDSLQDALLTADAEKRSGIVLCLMNNAQTQLHQSKPISTWNISFWNCENSWKRPLITIRSFIIDWNNKWLSQSRLRLVKCFFHDCRWRQNAKKKMDKKPKNKLTKFLRISKRQIQIVNFKKLLNSLIYKKLNLFNCSFLASFPAWSR